MDPGTIALVSLGVGLLGSGVGAISSIRQGSAQAAALKSQAAGARYNQQVAEMNAQSVERARDYQTQLQREKNQRLLGAQKVGYGKGGVTMEGTPLEVMADTASDQEKDIIAQRYNYDIQSWRYRSQAGQYGFEADRSTSMATGATTAGYFGAGTTLLTGIGRAVAPFMGSGPGSKFGSEGYGSESQ